MSDRLTPELEAELREISAKDGLGPVYAAAVFAEIDALRTDAVFEEIDALRAEREEVLDVLAEVADVLVSCHPTTRARWAAGLIARVLTKHGRGETDGC